MAGCANSGSSNPGNSSSTDESTAIRGILGNQDVPNTPTAGGTLRYATYSPVASLDPAVTMATGPTGGTELAAVYDVLMRYDSETDQFVPQLAESLQESGDQLSWTLKLRDGVTFSDGTPLDAAAVVASITRYNKLQAMYSEVFTTMVTKTAAEDARTVVFTLSGPWRHFPAILSYGHGMIVAPSADKGSNFTPIGAGPYTAASLQPKQLLELTKRNDYWGGAPNLDGLKFVAIAGDQPKIEALQSGGVDMIYLRASQTIRDAKAKFPGYVDTENMTSVGQINNAAGRPGSDPRVRRAMAYAIDSAVLDQRARGGTGMAGSDLFPTASKWHGDIAGNTPDADKARKLLAEAKADGYDGKITYVGMSDAESKETALAVQAQLNAVGFDATIDYSTSVPDQLRRLYVDRDFDIARGAYAVSDIVPGIGLFNGLHSSTDNVLGLKSPEMDALLTEVLSARDDDAGRAALGKVQEFVNTNQPFLNWSSGQTYLAWSDDVFGVTPSIGLITLFDKAFIGR